MPAATIIVSRKSIYALSHLAAEKDRRLYLHGVWVRATPEGTYYAASDGAVVGVLRAPAQPDLADAVEFILPLGAVKALKPKRGEGDLAEITVTPQDKGGAELEIDTGLESRRLRAIDGRFPDVARVIPRTVSGEHGHFNPRLLARFKDVAEVLGRKGKDGAPGSLPLLWPNGQTGTALVGIEDCPEFVGAVMPLRPQHLNLNKPGTSWLADMRAAPVAQAA